MGVAVSDPISAAELSNVAVAEGIKFLYQQAGEVLKRWRERRERGSASAERAVLCPPDGLLEGTVASVEPQDDQAVHLEPELRETRRLLADYAEGIDIPAPDDRIVAEQVDALRRLLEAVYAQRITFRGEQRPPSGPMIIGEMDVKQVAGDAAVIRLKVMKSGNARGSAKAKRVEEGGKLSVFEIGQMG